MVYHFIGIVWIMINHINALSFHGGNLPQVQNTFPLITDWIDVSTGINPEPMTLDLIPIQVLNQLPYIEQNLLILAEQYYGKPVTPIAGSQEFIEQLPNSLTKLPVLLPLWGYKAYQQAFTKANFEQHFYPTLDSNNTLNFLQEQIANNPKQHLVLINPNNPTGQLLSVDQVLTLAHMLSDQAMLIIDEAFIDCFLAQSCLGVTQLPENMIVLRSFGKFFGLAGLRLGFVYLPKPSRFIVDSETNPWKINGVAQFYAQSLFAQPDIQQKIIQDLNQLAHSQFIHIKNFFISIGAQPLANSLLFQSFILSKNKAEALYNALLSEGVLIRVIPFNHQHHIVRLGLCAINRFNLLLTRFEKALSSF